MKNKLFFLVLFLMIFIASGYSVDIDIDGINDFIAEDMLLTTTSGYTNWIRWGTNYIFIGYYGDDIDANVSDKRLIVYLSTNADTGTAYGLRFWAQRPVLPFKADFIIEYNSTNSWRSGTWDGSVWNWDDPFTLTSSDLMTSGNFLEMRIAKADLSDTPFLAIYAQFMSSNSTYGAIPPDTLSDGSSGNPSNFISFGADVWNTNVFASSNLYRAFDNVVPETNQLLSPLSFQSNYLGETIALTNFARDGIGIYKVEIYTNTGGLYDTIWVSNTNEYYYYDMVTTNFPEGEYNIYTLAYDTFNVLSSQTNTNISLILGAEMTIHKEISSVELTSIDLLIPGALINYKITYTNKGPLTASNITIYDKIPDNTKYYTNYLGTATGWTAEYAHIANPDQRYNSTDYDTITNTNVTWFRWKKVEVKTNETGLNMYLGVTVK